MRAIALIVISGACISVTQAQQRDYARDLFNTGDTVSGTKPFPDYDPYRLNQLYDKRHEVELQMFDVINEGALRHDPKLKAAINLYGKSLGYIPSLAAAHYKWAFGDEKQLDWLLAQGRKEGLGRDSLVLIVFGYMDEWDKTIRWLKENEEFNDKHEGGGAAGEVCARAIEIRKRLYGAERFEKAWRSVKAR
jgi:hypothetical protein